MIKRADLAAYEWLAIPVWVFNCKLLRITWGNAAALRFWDAASTEDLLRRDFSDTTETALARLDKVAKAALDGVFLEEQWTLYPMGHPKPVVLQSNVVLEPDGSTDGLLFCANNLKALPEAQLRGVQVLAYTPVLVALYSMAGEVLYRNPAAAEAWDGLRDPAAASPLAATFAHPFEAARLVDAIHAGLTFDGSHDMLTHKGRRTFALDCRPVRDPVDGARCIEMSARDISDYRALEKERDFLREQQMQAERAKLRDAQNDALIEKHQSAMARKLFVATASHELRTPIQTIIGCVDLLEEVPSEIEHCIREARDAANQMSQIASALVEFVRSDIIDPGQRLSDVIAQSFIESSIGQARKAATAKGLAFSLSVDGLDTLLRIDEMRTRQVLSNLAENAVKYTPSGHVAVRAALGGTPDKCKLEVVISDSGVGMSEASAEKLMQPFVRGPESHKIYPQGLGMGLAIVTSHLTELGGSLRVASALGEGTAFTVSIPCERLEPVRPA